jgi:hypothetical protein
VIGFAVFMIVLCAVWTWLIKRRPLSALVSLLDEGYGRIEGLLEPHIEGHFHGRFARFVSSTEGSICLSSFIGDYVSAGVRNQKEGLRSSSREADKAIQGCASCAPLLNPES